MSSGSMLPNCNFLVPDEELFPFPLTVDLVVLIISECWPVPFLLGQSTKFVSPIEGQWVLASCWHVCIWRLPCVTVVSGEKRKQISLTSLSTEHSPGIGGVDVWTHSTGILHLMVLRIDLFLVFFIFWISVWVLLDRVSTRGRMMLACLACPLGHCFSLEDELQLSVFVFDWPTSRFPELVSIEQGIVFLPACQDKKLLCCVFELKEIFPTALSEKLLRLGILSLAPED